MIPISVLDLSPIPEGFSAADALANTLDLARHAEDWGYRRFWLAEHHNSPGIASAATAAADTAGLPSSRPGGRADAFPYFHTWSKSPACWAALT